MLKDKHELLPSLKVLAGPSSSSGTCDVAALTVVASYILGHKLRLCHGKSLSLLLLCLFFP